MPTRRETQSIVPYHLATERVTVTGSGTATLTVQIPGDADFEARYINASATSVNATIQISDGGTRQEMLNRAVFLALVTGTGQQPYVIPSPALFVRNSSIQVDLADLSGTANIIQVVFCGFLVYPGPINRE